MISQKMKIVQWLNKRVFKLILVHITLHMILFSAVVFANSFVLREYSIKAAILYNFARFIHWPNEALPKNSDTFTLGVLGEDLFGEALNTIQNKIINGRKLIIKRYNKSEDIQSLHSCQMLYITSSMKDNLPKIIDRFQHSPVLTISDIKGFADQGGIINLLILNNKIKFEINTNAADRAGLKISSKLLELASSVKPKKK